MHQGSFSRIHSQSGIVAQSKDMPCLIIFMTQFISVIMVTGLVLSYFNVLFFRHLQKLFQEPPFQIKGHLQYKKALKNHQHSYSRIDILFLLYKHIYLSMGVGGWHNVYTGWITHKVHQVVKCPELVNTNINTVNITPSVVGYIYMKNSNATLSVLTAISDGSVLCIIITLNGATIFTLLINALQYLHWFYCYKGKHF